MNILVVEDNRVQSRIVKRCLDQRRRGDFVKVIPDAEEALKLLRDDAMQFDLLLLDWMLPSTSGMDVLQRVRQSGRHSDVRVIMQTAKDRKEHVEQAIEAGADDYLVKPLDCEALLRKVRKYDPNPSAPFGEV